MLTDLQNSFADRLGGKFATNSYLNIPPYLKRAPSGVVGQCLWFGDMHNAEWSGLGAGMRVCVCACAADGQLW